MAKAKPQRKPPQSGSTPAPAAKKPAGPTFDTTLAVESAAALINTRVPAASSATPRKESAAFRRLKEGLNQPAELTISKLLDKAGTPTAKKSNLPFDHGSRQVGHNQTFGADATKSGVPRRTGG